MALLASSLSPPASPGGWGWKRAESKELRGQTDKDSWRSALPSSQLLSNSFKAPRSHTRVLTVHQLPGAGIMTSDAA